jgi:hypothetical protein
MRLLLLLLMTLVGCSTPRGFTRADVWGGAYHSKTILFVDCHNVLLDARFAEETHWLFEDAWFFGPSERAIQPYLLLRAWGNSTSSDNALGAGVQINF